MIDNKDLISVVVPIFKVEKYLGRCIDSIICQTYKNFELILVDDGSPDTCPQICDEYGANYPNIQVIHQENAGLSAARNAGIDIAKGKYITFIDSDDFVKEDFLEILINNMLYYDVQISMCSFTRVYNVLESDISNSNADVKIKILNDENAMEMILDNQVKCTAWAKLYYTSLFDGLRYPVGKLMEDMFLTPMLFQKAKFIAVSDQQLYYYNQESNSIIRSKFNYRKIDLIDASRFWREFSKEYYPKLIEKANIHYYTNLINISYSLSQIKEDRAKHIYRQYSNILRGNSSYILSSKITTRNNKLKILFFKLNLFKYFVKVRNVFMQ